MKVCVDCKCELQSTGNGPGWMNSEQWDAVKAGDYFRPCPKASHENGNCYFWDTPGVPVLKRTEPATRDMEASNG